MRFATEYIQAILYLRCTNIYRRVSGLIDGNTSSLEARVTSTTLDQQSSSSSSFLFSPAADVCVWMDFERGRKKSKSIDVARRGAQVASLFSLSQCSLYLNVSILKTLVDWLVYVEQNTLRRI